MKRKMEIPTEFLRLVAIDQHLSIMQLLIVVGVLDKSITVV